VPLEIFEGFEKIEEVNEGIFEFMATNIVIGFLENVCLRID